MPFFLTNAVLLAALAGLGIPIAIHLLLKRRQVRMPFSTVRFFSPQEPQAKSRRKLRNLLLLLLRLLIFALIVFAFARPFLPSANSGPGARQPRQVVLVLDRSLSLSARDGSGLRWDAARRRARELLSTLTATDKAALVSCAGRTEVLLGFAPPALVAARLDELQPTHSTSDLGEGLREANRLLATAEPSFQTSIAIVSDLQRSAVDSVSAAPVPPGLEVQVLQVGDLIAPNLAVTDLQLEAGETNRPFATLANLGDEDAPAAEVELLVDDKRVFNRSIGLRAGASTNIEIALPTLPEGWHHAEFRLNSRDALAADNHRHLAFIVPPPLRVLVAEGRRGVRSFQEQSFFLTAALDPNLGTPSAGTGRFRVEKVDLAQLAARLPIPGSLPTASTNPTQRLPFDALFLPAQRSLPAGTAEAIGRFVRAGGGVVLFLGTESTPAGFNSAFADLLPAQILQTETAESGNPWRLAEANRTSAVFDAFRTANSGNLAVPEFLARFSLQPAPGAAVLARFDDGVPAVLARSLGAGRVLLVNTSSDTAWSDWPKHKTFVPWIHGIARHLAARTDDRLLVSGSTATIGSEITLEDLGPVDTRLSLVLPDGRETNTLVGPRGEWHLEPELPGIHRLRDAAGVTLHQLAAQVPAIESDLSGIRAADFAQLLVRKASPAEPGLAGTLFGSDQNRREYWRLLLMAAIALLFIETFVANRSNT